MARLEELERKFEENPRRYFAPLANEYRKSGDARRAADLCQSQLPEVPGHISGHIVLGQALYDVSDFAASRAALETALALDPENIVALRYLGDIARDTGDAAGAERWYRRTLEADPYNEAAAAGLQSLQDHPQAAGTAPEAVDSSPESEITYEGGSEIPSEPASDGTFETAPEPPAEADTQSVAEAGPETSPAPDAEAGSGQLIETGSEIQHEAVAESAPETSAEPEPESEPVPETAAAAEPRAEGFEPTSQATEPEPPLDEAAEPVEATAFTGDLEISAAPERSEALSEPHAALQDDAAVDSEAPGEPQPTSQDAAPPDAAAAEQWQAEPQPTGEIPPVDPAVQQTVIQEEPIQTEERVMESAAPFVTETMADLYMEQGYPHEALELLLQLSEQRPDDRQLAEKIEHLESVINARRDAAVAAARAERAEAMEPEPDSEPEPEPQPEAVAAATMREMFARMDRARPRPVSAVTAKPLSRLRSDFVPLPDASDASMSSDDPFAFPNPAPRSEAVPRTSGPQPTFNPSTAANDDFDAWLRGLKGS